MPKSKAFTGYFFEDFFIGQKLPHATPRTITNGDVALYTGLTGSRFALYSSDEFAKSAGFGKAPIDPMLVFHIVFGKSVPDISLNAVANLGYADGRFLKPVYVGDTLTASSEVIGLKENSNGKTGVVYVRTIGRNQHGENVLSYARWVMVNKRDQASPVPETYLPNLPDAVATDKLFVPSLELSNYNAALAGSPHLFDDYEVSEKIDHIDGMAIEEAEHQIATRLYQNTAKVHFDAYGQKDSRFGKRLIYGGVVISTARALSFNGLANAQMILGINAGTHCAPLFAGDTIYAWSEVLDKASLSDEMGALRLRLVATKDRPAHDFPYKSEDGKYESGVILDFDYWAAIPK